MSWRTEWNALAARIRGVTEAAAFYVSCTGVQDGYRVVAHSLRPQMRDIHELLRSFAVTFGEQLPASARACLTRFLEQRPDVFRNENVIDNQALQFTVTALTAFRSEFDYHVSDVAAFAARQSERAFVHMQRSIVADEDERRKWMAAFESGEIACERLGAIRLLGHGIWAFKVDGSGERTDLVLQEPIVEEDVERSADALVLTEWKVCRDRGEMRRRLAEAKAQTQLYRAGVLAGLELASYRYLVVVSDQRLMVPPDEVDADISYRHVNIVVEPQTPALAARAMARERL